MRFLGSGEAEPKPRVYRHWKIGVRQEERSFGMEEKAYTAMGKTGAFNLVLGICTMVAGVAVGVVMVIHGAKLLKSRKNIMF